MPRDALPERRYLDALLADLDAQLGLSDDDRPLRSVFIGGGTPSLFSGAAIGRLLDGIRHRCCLAADARSRWRPIRARSTPVISMPICALA
jgi:coproporphyrinogen III oxidase-like Fe-S oxidoreductase